MQIRNAHIKNVNLRTLQIVGTPALDIRAGNNWAGATFNGAPVDHGTYKSFDGSQSITTTNIDVTGFVDDSYSYETWLRTTGTNAGCVLAKIALNGSYHVSAIELVDGCIRAGHWTGVNSHSNSAPVTVTRDTWQHYAVTYTDGGVIRTFYNGTLVNTFAIGAESSPRDTATVQWFNLFALETTNFANGNPLTCDFGEFRYYSRALSDAEVAQNFEATRGRWGI